MDNSPLPLFLIREDVKKYLAVTKVTLALSSSPMALDTPPTHHLLAHNRPGTTTSPRHNLNTTTRSNNNPLCLEILLNKQEAKLSSHFLCFVSVIFLHFTVYKIIQSCFFLRWEHVHQFFMSYFINIIFSLKITFYWAKTFFT